MDNQFTGRVSSRLIIGACVAWLLAFALLGLAYAALILSQPQPQGVM